MLVGGGRPGWDVRTDRESARRKPTLTAHDEMLSDPRAVLQVDA